MTSIHKSAPANVRKPGQMPTGEPALPDSLVGNPFDRGCCTRAAATAKENKKALDSWVRSNARYVAGSGVAASIEATTPAAHDCEPEQAEVVKPNDLVIKHIGICEHCGLYGVSVALWNYTNDFACDGCRNGER